MEEDNEDNEAAPPDAARQQAEQLTLALAPNPNPSPDPDPRS
jgi:hypothetical protein